MVSHDPRIGRIAVVLTLAALVASIVLPIGAAAFPSRPSDAQVSQFAAPSDSPTPTDEPTDAPTPPAPDETPTASEPGGPGETPPVEPTGTPGPNGSPPVQTEPPGPPVNVTAAAGDLQASISWGAPASDGGSPIVQYQVSSFPATPTAVVDGSLTTTTFTGLTNGISYTFSVTAINLSNGSGPSSAPSASVTPAGGAQGSTVTIPPGSGGSATTDPGGTGPTPADPLTTNVTAPPTGGGGSISITETAVTGSPPAGGYQFLGQQVDIVSTAATSETEPLTIVFTIDSSAVRAAFALAPGDPLPAAGSVDITRAEGGGPPAVIPACTSTGGGGTPIAPTPACVADRTYINGNAALQATVLTASASHWTTVVNPTAVTVTDKRYQPQAVTTTLGGVVVWTFTGTRKHTVTDQDGLGVSKKPAYTSPAMSSGRFGRTFQAAGTYDYGSTVKGDQSDYCGSVAVPVTVTPTTGVTTTSFTVRWSTGSLTGYVFDVRYRFMKAGTTKWSGWTNWKTGRSGASDPFVSTSKGTYAFDARIRNVSTGNVSGWSPDTTIVIH